MVYSQMQFKNIIYGGQHLIHTMVYSRMQFKNTLYGRLHI